MRALILSAGLGERLRPLTLKYAKPAIDFLTVPMVGFPYYWLNTLGLSDITFNTHHLPETIRHAAMHVVDPKVHMHFPHENVILGSGGGIWNSAVHLKPSHTFAVANGDGVIVSANENLLREMLSEHEESGALATILLCPLPDVGEKIPGVWVDAQERVHNFGKGPKASGLNCFHYASVMLLSEKIWSHMPEGNSNILYDILIERIKAGDLVNGFVADDLKWFETGNAADYLHATRVCLDHLVARDHFGLALARMIEALHGEYRIEATANSVMMIAHSAKIPARLESKGFLVIGEEAEIAPGAMLENCVVLRSASVPANSYREQVLI
jgi:mannose-1-phosphate guanylyltransferase